MDVLSIALVVAVVWIALVVVAMALCRAAAPSDGGSERFRATSR
jgi:hypothetical protein